MSFVKPINSTELDISRVVISKPKDVAKDGVTFGKRVYLQYSHPVEGLIPLVIKTPKMKYNFGLSAYEADNGPKKYSLNAYFSENTKGFLTFCDALENKIKDLIVENSVSWFGAKKAFTRDIVDQMETLYPVVKRKYNKETGDEYPPSIKLAFPRWPNKQSGKEEFSTQVFLKKNQRVEIDSGKPEQTIMPGSEGEAVVFCSLFVSTSTKKVSMTMNANMIKLYPKAVQTTQFPFSDDEDEETSGSTTVNPAAVFSSSESETEEEPVPVATPVKKPVAKKPVAKKSAAPVEISESEDED